jgi:hypothetical protein
MEGVESLHALGIANMAERSRAFEQLNSQDQKALIDIAAGLCMIGTRLPALDKDWSDQCVAAYVFMSGVSPNVAKYAMADVARSLFAEDWEFRVTKKGMQLVTEFCPIRTAGGANGGEQTESRIITP